MSVSVCLSVTEVHWRIIANLGFKFRYHFTAHCGRRAACGRIISRHAIASARLSCLNTAVVAGAWYRHYRVLDDQWHHYHRHVYVCPRSSKSKMTSASL